MTREGDPSAGRLAFPDHLPVDHSFAHTAGLYMSLVCGFTLYFVDSRGGAIGTLRNIPANLLESNPHFLFTVPSLSGNLMKKIVGGVEEKGGFIEKLFKAGIAAGIALARRRFQPARLRRQAEEPSPVHGSEAARVQHDQEEGVRRIDPVLHRRGGVCWTSSSRSFSQHSACPSTRGTA